ncbi:hypothetical protein LCGC14_3150870 [marine sediment metagenome]|uniref:Uncharacterized protein n=1 Tax=marine sediment metagenome TaxID=412755 RepID=A0A0F8VU45_9ZZZZ
MDPETISYISGIVISVVAVVVAVIKSKKYKKIVAEVKDVLQFTADRVIDGKLTGKEIVEIITKIIEKF